MVAKIEHLRDRLLDQGHRSLSGGVFLLDRIADGTAFLYQRLLPFAEAMYLVMMAHDGASESERDALRGALRLLTDKALSSAAMEAMIAEFDRALEREGVDLRLDRLASAFYGDREDTDLAISLMAAMASADDSIAAEERQLIEGLAERLGVARTRLDELLMLSR